MLRQLPDVSDPDLLVGPGTGDDAAVYRLNDELALVQTVDFFPPIVDDPFVFGEIAAANAVSDVYAMGGHPLLALNIVGFPVDLPKDTLVSILRGGASKAVEAGMLVVGGHTVDDKEPKYGMAVTGLIGPGEQMTNAGARPGDSLVLTKPIGTGIITTAGKQQKAPGPVLDGAIAAMRELNGAAAKAAKEAGVRACVDVTGFGLVGHLLGMLRSSKVGARLSLGAVPVLDGAVELLEQDVAPGGTHRNLSSADPEVAWSGALDSTARLLLCDAQTSGGLLLAVAPDALDALLAALERHGVVTRAVVGEVLEQPTADGRLLEVTA